MTALANQIHPSATIEGEVTLGEGVTVGPNCILDGTVGPVHIGDGSRLLGNCFVTGPTMMGCENTLWPGSAIGGPPQDVNFDPMTAGSGLIIGDRNIFREGASVHRGKTEAPTRIGDDNYFMSNSHAGHDCVLGNRIQLASGALLAGHVTVGDRVIFGGNAAAHQFVRIGAGAMIRGLSGASLDVPPWCINYEIGRIAGLNLIGMRRSGMSESEFARRREVYRVMYRQGLSMPSVIKLLREAGDPVAIEYADFIESSDRGVASGRRSS